MEQREVNRQPGAIVRDRDGKIVGTLTLDALDGRIQTIRAVANPTVSGSGLERDTLSSAIERICGRVRARNVAGGAHLTIANRPQDLPLAAGL